MKSSISRLTALLATSLWPAIVFAQAPGEPQLNKAMTWAAGIGVILIGLTAVYNAVKANIGRGEGFQFVGVAVLSVVVIGAVAAGALAWFL